MNFFDTAAGQNCIEAQTRALETIAQELQRMNRLKAEELEMAKRGYFNK